ncbi:DUF3073 domain-containing protein [Paenibacillus sp. TRM 82003]|uniref:DUF3073 domain-containing protein n=1 Tax=Kineococcus sp. TRM81007 TaxID=2925831 RepID=UPI001F582BDC|nr:DUF3073 domain-containing protein [Kineococcus sp. TRM81007]MCI2237491.1 DUF3073 domain-containing protein [Kineococcus sp. TRM81007]MCI3919844.1 DUF3073 domain-containing protein [Paenibacillus sp. TRM 82003]
MGRGRQKAKQTKVARQLKYFSPQTDYNALQRELHGPDPFRPTTGRSDVQEAPETDEDETDEDTDWSRYSATDDYEDWATKRRA